MTNIILVGCGPHAQRIYFPIIEQYCKTCRANLIAIVELASKTHSVEAYLNSRSIRPKELMYVDDQDPSLDQLPKLLSDQLNCLVQQYNVNAVVISTDPLFHIVYARWSIGAGLHTLMDKPLSTKMDVSTSIDQADALYQDYLLLTSEYTAAKKNSPNQSFHLMAQRRYHPAFIELRELIAEVFERTNCPVTSIQTFHSDGQWRMPLEIQNQHYHPYNQGYGKCSHSGYHSLDMVPWLLEAAEGCDKSLDQVEIYTAFCRPSDFLSQINSNDYNALFPDADIIDKASENDLANLFKRFGEIDAFNNFIFRHQGKTITLGSVNLVHNGFSQRNWPTTQGKDLYKGNGRIRHESYIIEQGPFQALYFQSYQSRELSPNSRDEIYEVGGEYHLDIHIFRNNTLFPDWNNYQKKSIKDLAIPIMEGYSRGHQEDARRKAVIELLESVEGSLAVPTSDLTDHHRSVLLMHGIYKSAANRFNSQSPIVTLDFHKRPKDI